MSEKAEYVDIGQKQPALDKAAASVPDIKPRVGGPESQRPGGPDSRQVGGPEGDPPFRGRNEGVATGRPSEDDRTGKHDHDGWNSNT